MFGFELGLWKFNQEVIQAISSLIVSIAFLVFWFYVRKLRKNLESASQDPVEDLIENVEVINPSTRGIWMALLEGKIEEIRLNLLTGEFGDGWYAGSLVFDDAGDLLEFTLNQHVDIWDNGEKNLAPNKKREVVFVKGERQPNLTSFKMHLSAGYEWDDDSAMGVEFMNLMVHSDSILTAENYKDFHVLKDVHWGYATYSVKDKEKFSPHELLLGDSDVFTKILLEQQMMDRGSFSGGIVTKDWKVFVSKFEKDSRGHILSLEIGASFSGEAGHINFGMKFDHIAFELRSAFVAWAVVKKRIGEEIKVEERIFPQNVSNGEVGLSDLIPEHLFSTDAESMLIPLLSEALKIRS